MMANISEILDGLDDHGQQALYDALAFRRAKASRTYSRNEHDVWTCINRALDIPERRRQPLDSFVKSYGVSRYREACETIRLYLDEACGEIMRHTARVALIEKSFRAIIATMANWDTPLTPALVLGKVNWIDQAVDKQFPGYARAGLLHRLIRAA